MPTIKTGDRVLVECEVAEVTRRAPGETLSFCVKAEWLEVSSIKEHYPAMRIGDTVYTKDRHAVEIVGVYKDWFFVVSTSIEDAAPIPVTKSFLSWS